MRTGREAGHEDVSCVALAWVRRLYVCGLSSALRGRTGAGLGDLFARRADQLLRQRDNGILTVYRVREELGQQADEGGPVTIIRQAADGRTVADRVRSSHRLWTSVPGSTRSAARISSNRIRSAWNVCVNGRLASVSLHGSRPVPPGDMLYVTFKVHVSPTLQEGEQVVNTATVPGGGAPPASTTLSTIDQLDTAAVWHRKHVVGSDRSGWAADTQAGDHPYEFTTTLNLNTWRDRRQRRIACGKSVENAKDVGGRSAGRVCRRPAGGAEVQQVAAQSATQFAVPGRLADRRREAQYLGYNPERCETAHDETTSYPSTTLCRTRVWRRSSCSMLGRCRSTLLRRM